MPNRRIRELQRANSKKLDKNGEPLIKQRAFPRQNQHTQSGRYQSNRECDRRKRQIQRGSLKPENGLDLSYIPQYIFKKS